MRIVSLLPSATEILFALGLDREIVGVSHECDFPPRARTKPVVIHSRMPHDAAPAEIDRLVSEYVHRGESLYAVDAEMLESLAPDLIVTQDLCHVCAASPDDVWRDILWVGKESYRDSQAEALVKQIGARLGMLERQLPPSADRPRVAFLEWLQPFYVGGHWVPEMIHVAGGVDVLGKARTPSFRVHLQDIVEAKPDILLIAPCGHGAEQARDEYLSMELPEQWNAMPAVRNGRVYALEANGYFSRPGPRLVTGVEALAKLFHPAVEVAREAESAVLPISTSARAASV